MKHHKMLITVAIATILTGSMLGGCYSYTDKTKNKIYKDGDSVFSVGENNNGYDKYSAEVDRLTAVTPSDVQLKFLEMEYYNFIHFGMNTFTGSEWGTGKENPSKFNPKELSTDQWCEVLKKSGSKGIILTAKHHDGFCLWQTETTEHSIKNSPYKNGKGDIVAELAESCKKYGLKMGLYLSPWDMNAATYGTNAYNDFFVRQLTELVTNYGEIFSMWFDGARGEDAVLDADFEYDFDRFYEVIRKHQPNAAITVTGPDVRWIGNEAGVARDSEWSVISAGEANPDKIADLSQKNPAMASELKKLRYDSEDLGSREILANYDELKFYPAEVDVSIRRGWFFHAGQRTKSLSHLLKIYYKAVGGNSSLLLNVPVNKKGLIAKSDASTLAKFGEKIAADKSKKVDYAVSVGSVSGMTAKDIPEIMSEDTASYKMNGEDYIMDLKLNKICVPKIIDIREDLRHSQRIEKFDIYLKVNGGWMLVSNSTNVGNRRMVVIGKKAQVQTDTVRIVFRQTRDNPVLRSVAVYE